MKKIVFKASSAVTGCGITTDDNLEALTGKYSEDRLRLKEFPAQKYLQDKRVIKVISDGDRYGLTAISLLNGAIAPDHERDPYRVGLFTGITPASPFSNQNYFASMREAGAGNEAGFGETYQLAHPTTLLSGLPNNVLCYGSIILNAKGANSNYTSYETSGHLAVMAAASQLKCGFLDSAIAGGVSAHKNPVFETMFGQHGLIADTGKFPGSAGSAVADGAVFLRLEAIDSVQRGLELVGWSRGNCGDGILAGMSFSSAKIFSAIKICTDNAEVDAAKIGCVFVSGTGIAPLDSAEQAAVACVVSASGIPVVATARVTGNLMEAGGLLEIPFFVQIVKQSGIPTGVLVSPGELDSTRKPYALIVRTSVFGDTSCLLVKWNE